MAEFIVNPRRAPRAPARCRAAVVSTQGWFEAETEDIGSSGCQLVSPKLVRKGDIVQLHITNEKVPEPLKVSGRVAWVSPQAPWRVGIAFDEVTHKESLRWFELLVSRYPGLGGYRRVPDRIRADATVYLAAPPRFLLDFSSDEAMLLRAIGSGARLDELMSRLRDRWQRAQRALFSLIARQVVTFQRGQAVHPDTWKKVLSEVEAALAVEEMGKEGPAVVAPPPRAEPPRPPAAPIRSGRTPPPFEPARDARHPDPFPDLHPRARGAYGASAPVRDPSPVELPRDPEAPLEVGPVAASWDLARDHVQRDYQGAGVGWRANRARSAEAQAAFDRALAELKTGAVSSAIAYLRRALQLAPGDSEIAAELGKLAFKDRR